MNRGALSTTERSIWMATRPLAGVDMFVREVKPERPSGQRDRSEGRRDVRRRMRMVERQVIARGIDDACVQRAMRATPRHCFVDEDQRPWAYEDRPLPIACGQTISQPFMVGLMAQSLALDGQSRVLEVGTGSGYAAAVMGEIADEVFGIELEKTLCDGARSVLGALGYDNVIVRCGDGSVGWPEAAPFDAISVAAGAPEVAEALLSQLAIGGRLVIPVGSSQDDQELLLFTRRAREDFVRESLCGVRFVPLVGREGWSNAEAAEG